MPRNWFDKESSTARLSGAQGNSVQERFIYSSEDVLSMLDDLLEDKGGAWWDGLYEDRIKPIPFFVQWPDENLVEWFARRQVRAGRVLELGCGNGRNAVYLANQGCRVDAVDFSAEAIGWAMERATAADVLVRFQCCSIFDAIFCNGSYDFVYDHGCFHHLPPHGRKDYVELVMRALRPGGSYGLVCFRAEGGGGLSDREVYERRTLGGGLGYSRKRLLALWQNSLKVVELRQMSKLAEQAETFGEDLLWVLLAKKR